MWLILLISVFNVDQNKIDKAMEIIRPYYNEVITTQYTQMKHDFCPAGMSQFARDIIIEYSRDDIIIGDEPAETLDVSGYFYNDGDIIIINDGVLSIKNADFNLAGDIIMINQGKAIIDSSVLNFIQDYIYHHIIYVTDSASFSIENCTTSFNSYPFCISIEGTGEFIMNNVVNQDWITAGVAQNASVFLDNVGITGEWLFANDCYAEFNHVDNFLTWYFFHDSSVVDITFPDEDTIFGFYIDSTLSNVGGIGYHVEIDSSTDCMWATIPLKGSDVTINDSELRVTGLMFEGVDSFTVSGLVNNLFYPDYVLPIPDRNYHLINTSVQTWNLYPTDTAHVELSSSIFGELCGFSSSYSIIQNAFCDGTGGHIEASSDAFVVVFLSSIAADVITKGRGWCFLGYCSMPWGNIWVTGSSVMILINTQFPEDPIVSDTSLAFVAAVTAPSNANTEDTVGVIGSAWIDTGPYHPLDFDFYRLFYRALGESIWIPVGGEKFEEVRRDTLDYWNTVGLAPDIYEIKLVLKDNAGDSVEAMKQIRLRAVGIEEGISSYEGNCNIELQRIGPRLFYITIHDSKADIRIYDILGRQIQKINASEIYWTAPSSGIFFLKDKNTKTTKKIIVY
ncbi:T9SS type A sorting domain-containing protein [candidate division WOR-3 bacterium]|nr:T9SS type A sorting domain-containing protein [candidate division WOR-3 bacterium]